MVVTVEYRTGILGFLSDETKKLPGNIGLTDVVLALRWVKERVEDFGGDPNSVTLAGYGQGATIAHLLSLNHLTSSLFNKLILQSSSSVCDGSLSLPYTATNNHFTSPYYIYRQVLSLTRCRDLRCLQDKSVSELLRAQRELEKKNVWLSTVFTPMIDNHTRSSALVDTDPSTITSRLHTRSIPILLSATHNEGLEAAARLYLDNQAAFTSPSSLRKDVLPRLVTSLLGAWRGRQEALLEAVFRQYFTELTTGDVADIITAVGEMIGDLTVHSCMRETILLHRESNSLFTYIFSHYGETKPDRKTNRE